MASKKVSRKKVSFKGRHSRIQRKIVPKRVYAKKGVTLPGKRPVGRRNRHPAL